MPYLRLLARQPNFRRLWLAQVISYGGDWFNVIATVSIVSRFTDDGLAISGTFLARALPPFFLGPLAGVVADRFDRRLILALTDFSRAVVVLGLLLVRSADQLWLLYLLLVLQFSISAFFEPSRQALMPAVVEEDELLHANVLTDATWSAMMAAGAALGGLVTARLGLTVALLIDAASFLLSGLVVMGISGAGAPSPQQTTGPLSGWHDFIQGLRYTFSRPYILAVTLVKAALIIGSADVLFTVFAQRVYPIGEHGSLTLGLLFGALGVGAVIAPLIASALGTQRPADLERVIMAAFGLTAAGWLVLGWQAGLPLLMVGALIRGMGLSLGWTYSSVLLQLQVPGRFLGRVFAFDFGVFTLIWAASTLAAGYTLDLGPVGPSHLSLIFGGLTLIPCLAWAGLLLRGRVQAAPQPADG